MTHDEAYPLLPELLELRVAGPTETALRAHVSECTRCAVRLAQLERVAGALRATREAHGADLDDLGQRVLAIPVDEPRRPPSWFRRRFVPAGVAITAAASVAALTITLTRPDPVAPPATFEAQQTVPLRPVAGNAAGTVAFGRPVGATRMVRLKIHGLPMSGTHTFDLWLITSSGAVRAGSFGPDPDGNCVVDLSTPAAERWESIAITPAGSGPDQKVIARS